METPQKRISKRQEMAERVLGKEKVEQATKLFIAVMPVLTAIGSFANQLYPYLQRGADAAQKLWKKLEPYHPLELAGVVYGLALALFGSYYLLLIASVESARQMGFTKFTRHMKSLYEQYRKVHEQHLIDNAKDDDGNGIPDVDEISRQELFTRKLKLFARAIDPEQVSDALHGLFVAFSGVVATLRVQFAQTLALGVALADACKPLLAQVVPIISRAVDEKYRQWVPFLFSTALRTFCVYLAFWVQRFISAYYSAVRGGRMVAAAGLSYLVRHHYIAPLTGDRETLVHNAVALSVAALGLFFQWNMWTLPILLRIALFPFSIAENVLLYFVANGVDTGAVAQ